MDFVFFVKSRHFFNLAYFRPDMIIGEDDYQIKVNILVHYVKNDAIKFQMIEEFPVKKTKKIVLFELKFLF